MRSPDYDAKASKQTVSITLNSDLYGKAKALGVNASKVAEEAIADAYAALKREKLKLEIAQDLAVTEAYVEKHGSFAEMVRQHYEREDDAV